jgi:putative endonuclease
MNYSGHKAEETALRYLLNRGLKAVTRNYRCRLGEIDLVMRDGNTLVFVEVRLRSHSSFANAAESITAAKRRRLVAAAKHYLAGVQPIPPCRFDAVLFDGRDDGDIRWLTNIMEE